MFRIFYGFCRRIFHSCIFLCRFLPIPASFLLVPKIFSCHLSIKHHSTGYTDVSKDSLGLNKGACQQTLAKFVNNWEILKDFKVKIAIFRVSYVLHLIPFLNPGARFPQEYTGGQPCSLYVIHSILYMCILIIPYIFREMKETTDGNRIRRSKEALDNLEILK